MTVTVVDYGRGNLFSIGQALRHLNCAYRVSADANEVAEADRIVLPGVGAFGDCMAGLMSRGLDKAVKTAAARGAPILGICVGAQVMLEAGEEFGRHDGLALVPGTVQRLPEGNGEPDAIRIPNVGWRALATPARDPIMAGAGMVYFVHAYAPFASEARDVAATIRINGADVPAAFRRGNIVGFQFHPEKSGPVGLSLIARFLAYNA